MRLPFDVLVRDERWGHDLVLWVLQVLLAVAFFAHGWLFLSPPPAIAARWWSPSAVLCARLTASHYEARLRITEDGLNRLEIDGLY